MPTILFINGYRFFFYANEHLPVHIHISKGGASAKVNVVPEIDLVYNNGFKVREIKEVLELVIENRLYIIQKWYETFYE
jgi:hypothetical protein